MLKLSIASDHAGFELKTKLITILKPYQVKDCGTFSLESVDYPDYANLVCADIASAEADFGILVCGSGTGMSIAANRHKHIRAALCRSGLEARLTRTHNNANVLCLGSRISGVEVAEDIVREFLNTSFEGGRHQKRLDKLYQF